MFQIDKYKKTKHEIKKHCNKSFDEIQSSFQNNLISIRLKSSHNIPREHSKIFMNKQALIRRKIERSAIAFIDGSYYMLLSDYKKQRVSTHKGSSEIELKTLVEETVAELKDYYLKLDKKHSLSLDLDDLFELKLAIKPFPTINLEQYGELHKINDDISEEDIFKDIKEYIGLLTLEIYSQLKQNLMYQEYIETSKGIAVEHEEILKAHPELLFLTKTVKGSEDRDDYYKKHSFDKSIIDEIERQRAIWYYYKISSKIDLEDKTKRVLKPKVLDGFYSLKEKSEFFYDTTEDQEFKKQYDMILETDKLIEDYKDELEHSKTKK